MTEYWKFYDEEYEWDDESSSVNPSLEYTIQKLTENNISEEDARKLYNSGFVCFEGFNVLIDRFYGGPLSSYDFRTRFPLTDATLLLNQTPRSNVLVEKVSSIEQLKESIELIKTTHKDIIFRGQTKNYNIQRDINNPYYTIENYGEISLLPSVWRRMFEKNKLSFTDFTSLSLFEWSNIFYSAFDIPEIERRHQALNDAGEHIYTMSEMEDCDDELLSEFGKFRMDLSMGMNYNLLTTLTTLLQHYGLFSPVLDLTESLDVALFFATHKYEKIGNLSKYNFVGTNSRESVIYILGFDRNEMERHNGRDEFLKYLEPQRPVQQKCVICRTNQYSINLPTFYLKKVFVLDFETSENLCGLNTEDIFPNKNVDKFLGAILDKIFYKEKITAFRNDDFV